MEEATLQSKHNAMKTKMKIRKREKTDRRRSREANQSDSQSRVGAVTDQEHQGHGVTAEMQRRVAVNVSKVGIGAGRQQRRHRAV